MSAILSSFTLTYTVPLPAAQFQMGNLNEIAFMIRLEKLVKKVVDSEKKSKNNMVSSLIDMKNDIESTYNVSINTDVYVDQVSADLNKKGHKTDKKEFNTIKKMFKKGDKNKKRHAQYIAETMYLENYEMSTLDEEIMFQSFSDISRKAKDNPQQEEKEEEALPALLVYGVTVSLCGLFLMALPIPVCKDWGSKMVVAGVTACANSLCTRTDENNKKDKNKN